MASKEAMLSDNLLLRCFGPRTMTSEKGRDEKCRNDQKKKTIRLRFGHAALNSKLLIMGKHNTGKCDNYGKEETIEPVILLCHKHERKNRKLQQSSVLKHLFYNQSRSNNQAHNMF